MPSQKKLIRALKGRMRDPPIRQRDDEHEDIPDSQTRTKEWLTVTDKICKRWFDPSLPLPLPPVMFRGLTAQVTPDTLLACVADDQDLLHEIQDLLDEVALNRRVICFTQLQISRTVTNLFTGYDFEEQWPKLDEDAQEKYLLDAFKMRVSSADVGSLDFARGKLDCPELCREELMQDGGRGIMTLLKAFLLDNNVEPPKKPIIFPNSRFDAIIGWAEGDTNPLIAMGRMVRTQFIGRLHRLFEKRVR
jgi:hypothetical protein